MALSATDWLSAAKAGWREKSIAAAVQYVRDFRTAEYNGRELTRRGDLPAPAKPTSTPSMWVPLSDERQKVPPFQINARPASPIDEAFKTAIAAMEGVERAERPRYATEEARADTLKHAAREDARSSKPSTPSGQVHASLGDAAFTRSLIATVHGSFGDTSGLKRIARSEISVARQINQATRDAARSVSKPAEASSDAARSAQAQKVQDRMQTA